MPIVRNPGYVFTSEEVHETIRKLQLVMVANGEEQLLARTDRLESFCTMMGMKVNLAKTKLMRVGVKHEQTFYLQSQKVTECRTYKYLGTEVTNNLSWTECGLVRTVNGFKALYSFWNACKRANLVAWPLKARLFTALVQPVLLFGVQAWGPAMSRASWSKLERVHKNFLRRELGVHAQIQYSILLAETGKWTLEAEALLLTLQYVQNVQTQDNDRLVFQAGKVTRGRGWMADIYRWAVSWGIREEDWRHTYSREQFGSFVVKKLWSDPSSRQQYYTRDVNPMNSYREQPYLHAPLPNKTRVLIT
ncbi:hypothetical protein R1sor_001266 [Riccia sorocarpa]|uniref:Reverse transcriptase domain-containing protein n=1 Tax=Riccia sorocarpa TaxID=122646 RepID=A0ABD3GZE8_9MARC